MRVLLYSVPVKILVASPRAVFKAHDDIDRMGCRSVAPRQGVMAASAIRAAADLPVFQVNNT